MRRRPLRGLLPIAMMVLLVLASLTACQMGRSSEYTKQCEKRAEALRKWKKKDYNSFLTKKAELMADLAQSEAEHSESELMSGNESQRVEIEAYRARLQNQIDEMEAAEKQPQGEEPEGTVTQTETDEHGQWWGSDEWKQNPDGPPPAWAQ